MWLRGWRDEIWSRLDQDWDVIIIGGGITGAGVFRMSVDSGYKTLLVEARDFSYGTSSRSSKLVHGGFRYLRNRQYNVTRESVQEREWLLRAAPGLVTPLEFIMPGYSTWHTSLSTYGIGVVIYDLMGHKWKHRKYSSQKLSSTFPIINQVDLVGGYSYYDAQVDDSRLVLRILEETVESGGTALNYARVTGFLRTNSGRVTGIVLQDSSGLTSHTSEVKAKVVINCTGPWSDEIRANIDSPTKLRKLRGSHLIFPAERLPLPGAFTLLHPRDHRAMFAIPWEGVSLIGTTDLDHPLEFDKEETFCSSDEVEYILEAAQSTFPGCSLETKDIISSFSGLRPIIQDGSGDPSKASRAHKVWEEKGLVTITGGKLTTFRIMAKEALLKAKEITPGLGDLCVKGKIFQSIPKNKMIAGLGSTDSLYLRGKYGSQVESFVNSESTPIEHIHGLSSFWQELTWNARAGAVVHLEDLLLRRVRIGMMLPDGGLGELEKIRTLVQQEMNWSDEQWGSELKQYQLTWHHGYGPNPGRTS